MKRFRHSPLCPLAAVVLSSCVQDVPQPQPGVAPDALQTPMFASEKCVGREAVSGAICAVSLVDLIANPDRFAGHRVIVAGYLHLEFEGNGIYLHKDDFVYGLLRNGLWVDVGTNIDVSSCQDTYAVVEGTFEKGGMSGHLGGWNGTIKDITRCVNLEPR